uniref:Uncharacterized protein n=1 Tax=Sphenodon punctatus TaxID=8508 RepID=A0A8D0L4M2_SPHPU
EIDARDISLARLNKVLRTRLQSEKELQDVVQQQDKKLRHLIDKSGEVTSLQAEISQLQRELQKAKTEAKVLWKELRDQEPQEKPLSDIQEKVWLRQQVDKLRELMLEKDHQNKMLHYKHLCERRLLEGRLCQAERVLKSYEERTKETLSSLPEELAGCPELRALLEPLASKPAEGSSGDCEEEL